jgi:carbon-monoxide dehydrogenase medium subunit
MYPAPIADYQTPKTIEAALDLLSGDDDTMFIAGGMSLMQAMKARLVRPSCLIDLQHIPAIKGISVDAGKITIGAMTRYRDIAESRVLGPDYAALTDATGHVGDRQVRNRGTIGGSLCWNYISACTPVASIATGASIVLQSKARGKRLVPVDEFLLSPMETARQPDEIALAVTLPAPSPRTGSAYRKWGLVADALPVVGIGVCLSLDDAGRCVAARVGIGGLANGSQRFRAVEQRLVGLSQEDASGIAQAFDAVAATAEIHADLWTDEKHRLALIRTLGADSTVSAFARAGAKGA